jgi:hypothetical protein
LAVASTTGSQTVSPSECSMRGGRGRNCRIVPTMCKILFASAPVSCCASRTKRCEATEPAAASSANIRSKSLPFSTIGFRAQSFLADVQQIQLCLDCIKNPGSLC